MQNQLLRPWNVKNNRPPTMLPQTGLEWRPSLFGVEPHWKIQPQIDIVKHIACRALAVTQQCDVEFFAEGAFNKLYLIRSSKGEFIMRISLPVDPRFKTLSEVATLEFVRHNTDVPIPKVFAYDASADNELGFEWIIMERMPGKSLESQWRTMSFLKKEKLVKRIACFSASIFRQQFNHLGNIYRSESRDDPSITSPTDFVVDRIVSMQFFWGDHLTHKVARGPFKSSQEWLSARLLFHQKDCERILENSNDEDEVDDAKRISQNIHKLVALVPMVFHSSPKDSPEATALLHDDLSQANILVNEDGNLSAIVDWECVSALPLWKVCQLPVFLEGRERNEKPVKESYAHNENGEINELFWEHLFEYEQTQLRGIFLDEMKHIEPEWIKTYCSSSNERKADTELAIQQCDNELCIKLLGEWLDKVSQGEDVVSLKKRIVS